MVRFYPCLLGYKGESPAFGDKQVFTNIASFSDEITAKSARDMAESTIFRAFGINGVHGYSKPEGVEPPYATTTRELHDDELCSKVTDRAILNAARVNIR
ncbi:hypothetical protein L8P27_03665 [Enterobacter asburiae]|uniref:hypothetical protein n=1 Tax=Enterobacter asburiae TaxID=61645 RepID=UPI0020036B56|nr:hypothetical protein [Enterobacter asburiae]MCK7226949.1 hypothetical protein [Enterobacter asburiae]